MSTMITYSGRKIDPLHMTTDDICLVDIAHALSLLCRGGGHLKYFYSVGQHCINCAKEAQARGYAKRTALSCLLHDASEAYLSDVIRPVKAQLSNYLSIESSIMAVIFEVYGLMDLTEEESRIWRQIDDEMLDHELKSMMTGEENRSAVRLFSIPNLSRRNPLSVEKEYLELANVLLSS